MATENISEQAKKKHKFKEELKAKKDLFIKELEIWGSSDVQTLNTENEIAFLYLKAYQYDKALLYFKEVYYKRICILGPNNLDTIDTEINIGMIYFKQGRHDEALNIFNEIFTKIKEMLSQGTCCTLGQKHPDTQGIIRNIGLILQKQKKYAEAFEIFNKLEDSINCQEAMARTLYNENNLEKALEFFTKIRDKVLQKFGAEALETLTAKYHVGETLAKLSRWEEVLQIYNEVLEGRKKSLGLFHEHTLSALNGYGVALYNLGNIEESLDVLRKAHQTAKKVLGPDNERSLRILCSIGYILKSEGRSYESLQVYYDILSIHSRNNSEHAEALKVQLTIANIYVEQGKENEAYQMYDNVYKKIDEMSPKKYSIWKNMVFLLMKQGNGEEFLRMHKERYEEQKEALGHENPRTLSAYETLGEAHFYLKEPEEALKIFSDLFSKREVVFGIDHTDTLRTRQSMADTLAMQHNYAEATLIYKEVYNIRKALPFTKCAYHVLTKLATLLCLQEKYAESLSAFEERALMSLEIYDRDRGAHTLLNNDNENDRVLYKFKKLLEEAVLIRSPKHVSTLEIQNAVAEILQEQKLYEEALKVYKKVYQLRKSLPSFDPDDSAIIIAEYNVGNMYYCLGKFKEAIAILEDVHTRLKSTLGPEHPQCLDTQLQCAEALYKSSHLYAAISHYLDIYWKTKRKFGLKHRIILKCEQGITSIRRKLPKSKLVEKIIAGDFNSFLICLEEQKESINNSDATGSAPLHYASQRGHIDFVKSLLKSGAHYDVRDKLGKKPLDYTSDNGIASLLFAFENFFISVKVGDEELIAKLVANDILIDVKDKEGNTGLHHASREGHVNIVKILVENGADWSLRNGKGEVPIDVATSAGNVEISDILRTLSKTGSYRQSRFINEIGGNTSLHISARKGHLEILQELLHCGADPTDVNNHGYTPLHLAAYEGNTAIVEALLKFMKKTNVEKLKNFIGYKNCVEGSSALEIASDRGFTDVTKILEHFGADDVRS